MEVDLHPERSVIHAQVRKAKSNHCVDESGRYLRSAHHKGPSSKVYLGDVCETLLRCCVGAETPVFTEVPGFDEQRWMLEFTAGALRVSVQSIPYWGFGLLTSGYRNIIIMRGPVEDRARVIHDLAASAQHNPWEFAHRRSAEKGLAKTGSSLKANEMLWRAHQKRAKSLLSESIAALEHHVSRLEKKGDVDTNLIDLAHLEIGLAHQALADDNTPAVERALSRGEAALLVPIESEEETSPDGSLLVIEEDVPFVDMTDNESE